MSVPEEYHPIYADVPVGKAEIRLLTLHPGSQGEVLEADVRSVALISERQYAAISYHWGAPDAPRKSISCNGHHFEITESLSGALSCLRHETDPRTLWTDAICINQKDKSEKSEQVPLMTMIFQQASKVYIWLGEAGPTLGKAFRWAQNFSPSAKLALYADTRKQLARIARLPYFRRVWVIQEIALSRDRAHILYDTSETTIPWLTFVPAWKFVTATFFFRSSWARYPLLLEETRAKVASVSQDLSKLDPLLEVLSRFRNFEASDERDKVYALWGIARADEVRARIPIDYEIDSGELCRRVASAHLRNVANLYLLHIPAKVGRLDNDSDRSPSLPSWVPDWTQSDMKDDEGWQTAGTFSYELPGLLKALHSSSAAISSTFAEVSEDCQRLRLSGTIVDSVKVLGQPGQLTTTFKGPERIRLKEAKMFTNLRLSHIAYFEAEGIAEVTSKELYPPTAEDRVTTLGRILLSRFKSDDPDADIRQFHEWFQGLVQLRAVVHTGLAKNYFFYWLVFFALAMFSKSLRMNSLGRDPKLQKFSQRALFNLKMTQSAKGRRFARSKGGFLGLVPLGALEGDCIALFKSAFKPLLVKQKGSNWELIGDCYFHGLHDDKHVQRYISDSQDICLV